MPDDVRRTANSLLISKWPIFSTLGLHANPAHWNVKDPEFISLLEPFDRMAETRRS